MLNSIFIPDDTMVNHYKGEFLAYIDLEDAQIKICDCYKAEMLKRKGQILLFPYKEELCPFPKVLREYLSDRGIEVPKSKKAISYLHEAGCYYDFLDFQSEWIKHAYAEWCEQNNVKIKE